MNRLVVVVPSRSRPRAVGKVVEAWQVTGAFTTASLHWVIDADDPEVRGYVAALDAAGPGVSWTVAPDWEPLVPKLNRAAVDLARLDVAALGFAGDDHLPRTHGWAARYLEVLGDLGTGIVYGDDGYQHHNLPTQWAMTTDIVRELGAMVPAVAVDHLYCDNAVMDLGTAAGCLRYLPDVLIEHVHPVTGKVPTDAQYQRVNSRGQYHRDRAAYRGWQAAVLPGQADRVRALRAVR